MAHMKMIDEIIATRLQYRHNVFGNLSTEL